MTRFLMIFPLIGLLACEASDKDTGAEVEADTGTDADADADTTMSTAPGCDATGYYCQAYAGAAWAGQEEANCAAASDAAQAEGGPAMTYLPDGCPAGATAQCTGLLAAYEDGSVAPNSDYIIYFYAGFPAADAESGCTSGGGTYSAM